MCLSHDSKWTAEAIFNLLDNAVKYTPAGGTIRISVEQWEMYVKLSVSDNGKGIPESNQAAFFYAASDISVTFGFYNVLYQQAGSLETLNITRTLDNNEIDRLADRIVRIRDGRIVE